MSVTSSMKGEVSLNGFFPGINPGASAARTGLQHLRAEHEHVVRGGGGIEENFVTARVGSPGIRELGQVRIAMFFLLGQTMPVSAGNCWKWQWSPDLRISLDDLGEMLLGIVMCMSWS